MKGFSYLMMSFCLALTLALSTTALAQVTSESGSETTANSDAQPSSKKQFCPEPSKLINIKQWWGYEDWRSYDQSFVTQIAGFEGAQWVGVGVGTMICLYRGREELSFPVTVQNTKSLILPPKGGKWGAYANGRKNCTEGVTSVYDCPFIPRPADKAGDIYQQLDAFKQ